MYKNNTFKTIKPFIFTKKINDNYKTIYLKKITTILGATRYFPPATQEWFNSVYAYDNNYIKGITIADKNLIRLIKSYFNIYFSKKVLSSKRMITRLRRLSINKIFISKAELKHTTSKVIITLYVYNEERRILAHRIKRIEAMLFSSTKSTIGRTNKNIVLSLKEKLNILEYEKEKFSFKNWLNNLMVSISYEKKLEKDILVTIKNKKDRKNKELEIEILEKNLENLLGIISVCESDPISYKYYEDFYGKFNNKTLLEKEIVSIAYYKLLLNLNKSKFEDKFLLKLKPLISKIYNKEVEFNIVNLKTLYLNSDIFTQAMSLKLKNRDNRLLRVLRSFLYMVKLPKVNIMEERFNYINPKKLLINKVKNLRINSLFNKDNLNHLLLNLFQSSNFLKNFEQYKEGKFDNRKTFNGTTGLLNCVLNTLKHKNMAGVRLEAKGRLTRRLTASRSVFKIKWKGSLKNIDSSYRGLSSVMLRGYIKSNVQYSIINSKTRNGAFGLKGWISGK